MGGISPVSKTYYPFSSSNYGGLPTGPLYVNAKATTSRNSESVREGRDAVLEVSDAFNKKGLIRNTECELS